MAPVVQDTGERRAYMVGWCSQHWRPAFMCREKPHCNLVNCRIKGRHSHEVGGPSKAQP